MEHLYSMKCKNVVPLYDLLLEMLEKHEFVSSQQTVEMMKADVVRHANGAEQSDDLTMLCVKVKGNLPKL
jgi:serine phosphatase RsbU (regulator of sigma subunit)